ncbi:MAG: ABC transporter substrate-binding protein [Alphaproteobacteria bacterium]|nr:ABC transporter substrate-binding protein [Alphaproteobacteria bacterium]MBL7098066.1 ABC transporter substrate-binding protein [Alphaproteobacteria bacterium]
MKVTFVLAALLLCVVQAVAAGAPRRIVSTNLCADQYLIALADKDQIAALSEYARDPALSFYAREAQAYPTVRGNAEGILPLKPDLIVGSPSRGLQTRSLLKRFGLGILDIGADNSFADIVEHTRLIADAIGHPGRGAALIAKMQAQLAQIPALHAAAPPTAVYYQRQGFVTGPGTLMDEMMRRVGLSNMAIRFADGTLARVDLETIVSAQPDFIIFTNDRRHIRDWGAMLLNHPALAAVRSKRIYVPDNLTVCGGPSYPPATAALSRALHAN